MVSMQNVTQAQSSGASLAISHQGLHYQGDYIVLSPRGSIHWGEREEEGQKTCTQRKAAL